MLDAERLVRHYPDARALLRELKSIGARNAAAGRSRGLTSPRLLARMIAIYEQRRQAGGIPATWEVIYGAAFGGWSRQLGGAAGEAYVPVSGIRRRGSGA